MIPSVTPQTTAQVHKIPLDVEPTHTALFHKYNALAFLFCFAICLQLQVSTAPTTLTRHNSLVTSAITHSNINAQINKCSPTLSRKDSQNKPKTVNISEEIVPKKTLPNIRMNDCAVTEREVQRIDGIKKILKLCEPTGCLKEREEFSLYIFPQDNRYKFFSTTNSVKKFKSFGKDRLRKCRKKALLALLLS